MESNEKKRFARIFTELCYHFPNRFKNSSEMSYLFNNYCEELADIPIEKIAESARAHIRTSDHFPYLSELLQGTLRSN